MNDVLQEKYFVLREEVSYLLFEKLHWVVSHCTGTGNVYCSFALRCIELNCIELHFILFCRAWWGHNTAGPLLIHLFFLLPHLLYLSIWTVSLLFSPLPSLLFSSLLHSPLLSSPLFSSLLLSSPLLSSPLPSLLFSSYHLPLQLSHIFTHRLKGVPADPNFSWNWNLLQAPFPSQYSCISSSLRYIIVESGKLIHRFVGHRLNQCETKCSALERRNDWR